MKLECKDLKFSEFFKFFFNQDNFSISIINFSFDYTYPIKMCLLICLKNEMINNFANKSNLYN